MNGSLIAPAAMILVLAALRLGLLRPLHGLMLFLGLWALGIVASAILAYRAVRADGSWMPHAAVALLLLGALAVVVARSRAPAIHDITTSPDDPPELVHAAGLPANAGRDLAYPHGDEDTPEIQRRAYPELGPVLLPVTPGRAHDLAVESARELGWEITWSDRSSGRLEAVATSTLFRFADDVAVRVRPIPEGGSRVDVRSTSRVGRSDLGANAERIRAFASHLRAHADEEP